MIPAVTVSMPYYRTPDTVERAVRSVLDQTRGDLLLVVVNDGDDPGTAWEPLAGIDDPRLIRFDLPENRGRYYADAVTLAACETPWFTVHDSDDWSDPDRHQVMFDAAEDGTDVVFTGHTRHRWDGHEGLRRRSQAHLLDGQLRHVAVCAALWSVEALRSIGGPHPGWRIAYDTLLTSVAAAHLAWAQVPHCGYHAVRRDGSLTTSDDTGMRSDRRTAAHAELRRLWSRVRNAPTDRVAAKLAPPPAIAAQVQADADRLREVLPCG